MARKRLSMRKIKQILRLKWDMDMSNRSISRSVKVSRETVREYLKRATAAGYSSWEQVKDISEAELEKELFASRSKSKVSDGVKRLPDWQKIHMEFKRPGVTLSLLWQEYMEEDPASSYRYSQFCNLYRKWKGKLPAVMVQDYKGGEYLFVDYAGMTVPWIDPGTGEEKKAQIFVATLGGSNYTYVEAQPGQFLESWIKGHINALDFFGGVPEVVVPDNLKSGVTSPCYYEPDINPVYDDLATHYGFAVIPARVRKPRDKAKVETSVQVVERWVLAPLRNRQFFSIQEINDAIGPLLEKLNNRVMKHIEQSRSELFKAVDEPALRPLPEHPFEYAERKKARVGLNYHVTYKKHHYSVPYRFIGKEVELRITSQTVEVYYMGERLCSHVRDDRPGRYSTSDSHMPSGHKRRKQKWSPERFVRWARKIGTGTGDVITYLLGSKRHPEQAYRSCLGILKLSETYGEEALESACRKASRFGLYGYKYIHNILKNGTYKTDETKSSKALPVHQHVRGGSYYH